MYPTAHCLLAQLARHTQEQGQRAGGPQGGGEAPEQWVVETLGPLHPPQMWEGFRPDAGGAAPAGVSALEADPVSRTCRGAGLPALPPSLPSLIPSTPGAGAASSPRNTPRPQPCPQAREQRSPLPTFVHRTGSRALQPPRALDTPGTATQCPVSTWSWVCAVGGSVLGCLEPHQPLQTQPLVLPGPQPSAKLLSPPLVHGLSTVAHPSWRTASSGASVAPEGRILTGDLGRGAGSTLTPALPPPVQRSPHPDPWNPALM